MRAETPIVQAFLVCQDIAVDGDGNATLWKIFDKITVSEIPTQFAWHFFIRLLNGKGTYTAKLELVRLRDDKVVAQSGDMDLTIPDPLVAAVLQGGPLPTTFKEEGNYEFRLLIDGASVARYRMRLERKAPQ